MSSTSVADLYGGGGDISASVPEGIYDVRISEVRTRPESRLLFIDLEVLNGPAAGKVAQVSLYVPEASNRNALFHYRKKTAAFAGPELISAIKALGDAPTIDGLLDTLAEVFTGKTVTVSLNLRSDGEYAGQNELISTQPMAGQAQAPIPPAAEPPSAVDATPIQTGTEVPF